jgi:hypothetical protein
MKRYLNVALALLVASSAQAQTTSGQYRKWSESQALTRAAPTNSCYADTSPEGMDLRNVRGYRVIIEAASGQTLSGGGTLHAYVYSPVVSAWIRNNDLDLTVDASSVRRQIFPDLETKVRAGCVLYATSSVTVSSGTVTVYIEADTGPL